MLGWGIFENIFWKILCNTYGKYATYFRIFVLPVIQQISQNSTNSWKINEFVENHSILWNLWKFCTRSRLWEMRKRSSIPVMVWTIGENMIRQIRALIFGHWHVSGTNIPVFENRFVSTNSKIPQITGFSTNSVVFLVCGIYLHSSIFLVMIDTVRKTHIPASFLLCIRIARQSHQAIK